MLRENGLACGEQQNQVWQSTSEHTGQPICRSGPGFEWLSVTEEWDANRVQGDRNPCEGLHPVVLSAAAVERVVSPQERRFALVKAFTVEGPKGA